MNKPAQFTPGPWVVNTFIVNGQHKLEVLDATGSDVARCLQHKQALLTRSLSGERGAP